MKNLIRKWLDIPTREEINRKIISQVDRRYNKLKKADKDRYKQLKDDV